MKGYSFQELVNLAEAAVKRAGDTMTGNLTALKVLVSGAQGTEANALTRYDYFTSQLPERATRIPGGADLNTYRTAGFYYQDFNADAISGSNYPASLAGSLTVLKAAGVTQEYRVYSQSLTFKRGYYDGAWSAWQKVYDAGNKPTAADVDAVSKAGDTMTGVLIVPDIRGLKTAQGSGGQNVEVSSEGTYAMMWRMNNQYGVKADEFIGIDYASNFIFRQDRGLGNGLYTDHLVYHQGFKPTPAEVGAVAKAGDTMTGQLQLQGISSQLRIYDMDQPRTFDLEVNNGAFNIVDVDNISVAFGIDSDRVFTNKPVISYAVQSGDPNALTRKDYVDGQVATRAPTAHTHTAADVGAVSKGGDTMTGSLQVRPGVDASGVNVYGGGDSGVVGLVDATGTQRTNFHYNGATGIGSINTYNASGAWVSEVAKWDSASGFGALYPYSTSPQSLSANALTRKDYVDGTFVKKSGDTMTGDLRVQGSIFGRNIHATATDTTGRLVLAPQGGDVFTIDVYPSANSAYQALKFDGANRTLTALQSIDGQTPTAPSHLTRKDYVDNLVSTYNHPAYRGNSDVVAGGWNHVGAYVMAQVYPADGIGEIPPGNRLSGAFLRPCSMDNDPDDMYGATLPGAWQCQGYARGRAAGEGDWTGHKTLWIRVA